MSVAVRLEGWGWRHAGRRHWAVRDLDLEIPSGQRVLLLGASGSGKSTVLAGLAGLLHGQESGEAAGELRVQAGRVGLLMQDPESQIVMNTAGDDVAFGPENKGDSDIWSRVDEALARARFPYGRDRLTGALSGGQQQRLALAGVLALRPGLLLLDEPTANLDPASARELVAAIADLADVTLIVVEHRVRDWLPHVDRVIVLGDGIIADGAPDTVLAAAPPGVWLREFRPQKRRASSPPGEVVLRAEQVAYRYRAAPELAAPPIDLELRAGELLAVEGASGAGKSTLAMMAAGLQRPTSGRVLMPGYKRDLYRWSSRQLARQIGTVFQNPEHQFLRPTVRQELLVAPKRLGWPTERAAARADDLLARLRLDQLAAANPFTLSGGQKRRLSVATALAAAPPVLILDEPTFGQDPQTWLELVDILTDIRDAGAAVLAVSHDQDFVAAVADRRIGL